MTISSALDALAPLLGDRLSLRAADRDAHGQSESHFAPTPPDAVAWPRDTEEVSAIVRICADHGCPVIPFGAGTSLEGHTLAPHGGLTLNLTKMNRILCVHAEDRDAVVQPGVTREDLNTHLRDTGLFFPVDPGANASLGGMAATRASGTTTVRYGTMHDNVAALEVVLADGRIIRTGNRAAKSSAGYDLTGLFVGAEGTLGIITELTLRLHGQPQAISSAVCAFRDVPAAVEAATQVTLMGLAVARMEFLDRTCVAVVAAASKTDFADRPHLFVEFHGSETSVAEDAATFAEIARDCGGDDPQVATRPEERTKLWEMRHRAFWSILAHHPGKRAIVTDVCVPVSALAQAIAETQADIAASRVPGPILGHVGDGNFHAALLIDDDSAEDRAAAMALSAQMAERALRLGGTVTGEHGIGMGKLAYMDREHGEGWDVMAQIKRALDPDGLMNPGKMLRQPGG
ncbi:FAD-binding protein [Salipiger sp. IMCC34102]|uniref:FAD-binding oxidoreductase n=1 Tax=Salipiger sp. IMCC34102 TaxID=2510647 RepID=UPI00101DCFFC|nr:FAD-linked oxidase C-terminal domain-containing protein [Salipiger sp. IMCC34102]RYH02693.1 FAD-binding protein [Salipiger sp. IMCC34102]